MDKRIVYMTSSGQMAVVIPYAGDRRVTLNADGEKLFAAFPDDAAAIKAELVKVSSEHLDKLPPPFAGMSIRPYRAETDDEFVARIMGTPAVDKDATSVLIVDVSELPTDLDFRDAWSCAEGKPGYDMGKARDIKRSQIRTARAALFTGLDIEYMRLQEQVNEASRKFDAASAIVADKLLADVKVSDEETAASNAAKAALEEIEAKQADIVARKQALRDAPADPRIDAAATIDELRAIPLPTSA